MNKTTHNHSQSTLLCHATNLSTLSSPGNSTLVPKSVDVYNHVTTLSTTVKVSEAPSTSGGMEGLVTY